MMPLSNLKPERNAAHNQIEFQNAGAPLGADKRLIPLVPMIETAWADGKVSKHEYWLVVETAMRIGIEPDTTAFETLHGWLKVRPADQFFSRSFDVLSAAL